MPNPTLPPRSRLALGLALLASGAFSVTDASAQERTRYLNPVIERLAKGEPFVGVSTGDFSIANARTLTRAPIDYVYVDMEHAPFSLETLHLFTLATIDRASTYRRGDLQSDIAVFARFPPYGRESSDWVVKQALDIGLMGIIFNSIDNVEQATRAVASMRYPPQRGAAYPEPAGTRGWSPGLATWLWGVPAAEYREVADVWPLNPDGELLAIMMIESADGLANVDAIAAVPGVGALFIGPADLALSMGVPPGDPEIEEALQTILAACLAHDVACGKTMSASEMAGRLEEGWRMINLGSASGGMTPTTSGAMQALEEATGRQ